MILRFQHVLDSNYFIKNPLNVFDLKLWLELTWLLIQPVFKQKKDLKSGAVYGVERNLEICPYLVVKEKNNNCVSSVLWNYWLQH